MAFGLVPLEKRLKENIKNYSLDQIYQMDELAGLFKILTSYSGFSILLTDRHGEKVLSTGGRFVCEKIDVNEEPGEKISVAGRTIAHLYIKIDEPLQEGSAAKIMKMLKEQLIIMGENAYNYMEASLYIDELENKFEKEQFGIRQGEKLDPLTGALNHTYFANRLKVIDRSGVIPVAVINININDWKYVNDNYGDEESDRLIKVVAGFLLKEAKAEYVVGRCGGDSFQVLIPMAEEGEAEEFCIQVQDACMNYEDEILAPSVAYGFVMKTNVEEKIEDLLSDAEYEMFNHKLEVKSAPGYKERLMRKS